MTRTLVGRLGAFGDCLIITPLLKHLKSLGDEVYVLTSSQGMEVLKNNPNVDKLIPYAKDSVPNDKLGEFFEATRKGYECDRILDMNNSLEVSIALYPFDPRYNYPKYERAKLVNKNYYDWTMAWAGYPEITGKLPEFYPTQEEEDWVVRFYKRLEGKYVILWGLSGSGRNKGYPFADYVMSDIVKKYSRAVIITVGDDPCKILECGINHPRIERFSGVWSMRKSIVVAKYANLVVSPDTGLLHGAGCWDVPKAGLLGHSTIANITKYFKNDYSIESQCECSPCFRIIHNAVVQCPIDTISGGCWCMTEGMNPKRVYQQITSVIDKKYGEKN